MWLYAAWCDLNPPLVPKNRKIARAASEWCARGGSSAAQRSSGYAICFVHTRVRAAVSAAVRPRYRWTSTGCGNTLNWRTGSRLACQDATLGWWPTVSCETGFGRARKTESNTLRNMQPVHVASGVNSEARSCVPAKHSKRKSACKKCASQAQTQAGEKHSSIGTKGLGVSSCRNLPALHWKRGPCQSECPI